MTRLIESALRNRAIVLILAAVLIAAGLFSMQRLPFDAEPDISPLQVLVTTQAPGLAPVDVERSITSPLELALQGLPGMQSLRSISRYGLSVVYVRFADGTDIYLDRNLVSERLQTVQLPPGTSAPQMGPLSDGLSEIYQFQVRGHAQSPMALRTLLDWQIAPKLRQVEGVVDVNVNGGLLKTYEVSVNDDALTRYGLSVTDVFNAVQMNNGATGGATIEHNGGESIIRGEGLLHGTDDIGDIVLKTSPGGAPLYVRDVARVTQASMPRLGAVTRDGKGEAVVGVVLMGLGQNTRVVAARVQDAIKAINATLPPGVEIAPYYNRADLMNRVLDTVAHNMVEGAVLVIAVLLLLLGNIRAGLVVALAIPLSMLAAVIAMYSLGMSGNLMSLGAIDFGLLVDGAVVMIENVVRRRAEMPDRPMLPLVRDAAKEVARPVTFAILIITAVYLPILSLQGIEGKMFRPMATTVVLALVASLVVTIVLMPVLASFALRGKVAEHESRIVQWVRRRYEPVLVRASTRPGITMTLALALLAVAALLATRLGAEFLPRLEEGALTVTTTKLPGISVPSAVESQTMVERTLLRFPEVQTAVTLGGSSEIPTDPMGVEQSDTFVMLKPKSEWKTAQTQEGLVTQYSAALDRAVPGMTLDWAQPIEMRMDDMLAGVQADVAIVIHGGDLDTLHDTAERVAAVVSRVPGAADVEAQQTIGQPYLRVIVNRDAVARYGLNASQVLDLVQSLGGKTVGTIADADGQFDVRVRMQERDHGSVARIGALRVSDGAGHAVPLSQVAEIRMEPGPSTIEREQGQRVITVQANVRGRDLAGFVVAAQHAVDTQVKLPPGYTVSWGGSFKNLQDAMSRLYVVVPISLAVIFGLLYLMFRRAWLAALIFCNVPFSAIGGIVALWIRGLPFSISAAVGFIALFGIAVLNGVVLVAYIVEKRATGLGAVEAARQAASTRLRPVLMTATVASLGFLPMAFSTSSGAEVQRPLATVVIGGLVSATLLTLLVLPAVYPWFDRRMRVVPPAQHEAQPEFAE
ncbi:MAG TPA: CusA/CzcA family heavy metal efflux RND transporter [Paraburkholderia sp.]|jgi:cobalt-zinc-cadmium resistance protein CzcA|nr:CusA/CzcA family heavy metal efflux RND transporter [Paraburkholderia sp.]